MLTLPSFRDSLSDVIQRAVEMQAVLRLSLTSDIPLPDDSTDLDDDDWKRAVAAYRLLWEIAHREGREEVLADIKTGFPTLDPTVLVVIEELLAESPGAAARIRGIRKRDRFLPILNNVDMSLDLRFIEFASPGTVAPVITARLEFDESVGGAEAISVQIPISQLDALIKQSQQLQGQLASLRDAVNGIELAPWSLEGVQSDSE
ncbi:hypothetical protein C5C71_06450 [Rathayibacter sp. AY1C1]|nr:hypothetical protein C5C71_06450 [Rathayibacter sp. AY1C1]